MSRGGGDACVARSKLLEVTREAFWVVVIACFVVLVLYLEPSLPENDFGDEDGNNF